MASLHGTRSDRPVSGLGARKFPWAGALVLLLLSRFCDAENALRVSFVPGQTVRRPDVGQVSLRLSGDVPPSSGALAVLWQAKAAPPCQTAALLPSASMAGVAMFQNSTVASVQLPIAWDAMSAADVCTFDLTLTPLGGSARAQPQHGTAALTAYGVPANTCPPGTALAGGADLTQSLGSEGGGAVLVSGTLLSSAASGLRALAARAPADGQALVLTAGQGPEGADVYSAMVNATMHNVTLCTLVAEGYTLDLRTNGSMGSARPVDSGCNCSQMASAPASADGTPAPVPEVTSLSGPGSCQGWRLGLETGTNMYALQAYAADASGAPLGGAAATPNATAAGLAVVRLAPRSHVGLAFLNLTTPTGTSRVLCLGTGQQTGVQVHMQSLPSAAAKLRPLYTGTRTSGSVDEPQSCVAGSTLDVTLPTATQYVTLRASLAHPEVAGIRLEVGGQVLSRSGADDAADALGRSVVGSGAAGSSALPAAFILGLVPGLRVEVDVLVIGEDGVTSARYPLRLLRASATTPATPAALPAPAVEPAAPPGPAPEILLEEAQEEEPEPSPTSDPACTPCPAGWASGVSNATACAMCPPGTQAAQAQSPECTPCSPGSYSYSWGSSACKRCISGTFSAARGSVLCELCPAGTGAGDGSASCEGSGSGGTDGSDTQFAVVVSFAVTVRGLDSSGAVLQAGVAASPADIVAALLRADTAAAFNVPLTAVSVASLAAAGRRTLRAAVTASLDVTVPGNASDEEVAAALEVQRLSADAPIAWLSDDPDTFFGRTTATLAVSVTAGQAATAEVRPVVAAPPLLAWALMGPGLLCLGVGAVLLAPLAPRRGQRWAKRLGDALSPRRGARGGWWL